MRSGGVLRNLGAVPPDYGSSSAQRGLRRRGTRAQSTQGRLRLPSRRRVPRRRRCCLFGGGAYPPPVGGEALAPSSLEQCRRGSCLPRGGLNSPAPRRPCRPSDTTGNRHRPSPRRGQWRFRYGPSYRRVAAGYRVASDRYQGVGLARCRPFTSGSTVRTTPSSSPSRNAPWYSAGTARVTGVAPSIRYPGVGSARLPLRVGSPCVRGCGGHVLVPSPSPRSGTRERPGPRRAVRGAPPGPRAGGLEAALRAGEAAPQ